MTPEEFTDAVIVAARAAGLADDVKLMTHVSSIEPGMGLAAEWPDGHRNAVRSHDDLPLSAELAANFGRQAGWKLLWWHRVKTENAAGVSGAG